MMKNLWTVCAALIAPLLIPTAHAKSVVVYNQKLDADKVCGDKFAKSGCASTGKFVALTKYDIALQTDDNAKPVYPSVLGRIYRTDNKNVFGNYIVDGSLVSLDTCGLSSSYFANPSSEYSFKYSKKASSVFNLSSGIDIKEALLAANVPANEIDNLQAKFDATYGKNIKDKYELKGSYYRLELSTDTIDRLKGSITGDNATDKCRTNLSADTNSQLIWSVALVRLDTAEYTSDIADKIATNFAAQVQSKKSDADIASLKLSLSREIQKNLAVSFKDEWRVIAWDYFRP